MEGRGCLAASPTPAEAQLALRLRQLREDTHLTQAQIAALFSTEYKVGAASISSWENVRTPTSPPQSRLEPYARLVVTSRRRGGNAQLPSRAELIEAEEDQYQRLLAELERLWQGARGSRAENDALFPVSFKLAGELKADDLSGHLILLGGVAWNDLTRHLLRSLTKLPVRQFASPDLTTGENFAVGRDANEQRFEPEWAPDDPEELIEDVGLLARVRNPYNSSRTLTLCNGIHSRGVLGAVRALTDVHVRDANESYLAARFGTDEYAILMRVPVFQGETLSPDLRNPESRLYEWPPEAAERGSK